MKKRKQYQICQKSAAQLEKTRSIHAEIVLLGPGNARQTDNPFLSDHYQRNKLTESGLPPLLRTHFIPPRSTHTHRMSVSSTPTEAPSKESIPLSPSSEVSTATSASEPSLESSTEPTTPDCHAPPVRRVTKNPMDALIEEAHWYTNMGGALSDTNYTRTKRVKKKTLEEQMAEDEAREAEKRRIRRAAIKLKKEAEAAKKREELERKKQEAEKAKELKRLEKKKEQEELKKKRKQEQDANRSKSKKPKTASVTPKKASRSPVPSVKSESPDLDADILQQRTQKKETLVDNYFPFFNTRDDVEIPIRADFFAKEIYEDKTRDVITMKFQSAAELIKESPKKYKNYKGLEAKTISLRNVVYPNIAEDYYLLESQDLQLDPLEEIGRLIEMLSITYFPEDYKLTVYNPQDPYNSLAGEYSKAYLAKDYVSLLAVIDKFNNLIESIHAKGEFSKHLQNKKTISRLFLHEFLNQIYSRSVSPQVSILKGYRAFSNNVYGELMPKFLSTVFDQVGLSSHSTFIDLGSGVGNVTIQAALEYGCESYGCEMMENCSILGDLHAIAFEERCKLFGLNPGKVKFFNHQSFVDNKDVKDVVDRCDVILVNNFLFTADLNKEVMKLFSNLKPGTKIISLKRIIPDSYSIDFDDIDNYMNKFEVKQYPFGDNSVSWTSKGGQYYVTEFTGLISESALTVFNTRSRNKALQV